MTNYPDDQPFALVLDSHQAQGSVWCEELLRDLPGKRRVYKGSWNQRAVLVKLFLDSRSARRHWERERTGVEALKGASVATPELLYAGALEDGTPTLIFDFLPEAQTALQVWERLNDTAGRNDFLRQMIEIVAALHDAGLVQDDLHFENFLVSGGTIFAIDGDGVSNQGHGDALSDALCCRNLALMFAQLSPSYDALIDRAVQRYAELRHLPAAEIIVRLSLDLPDVRQRRRHKYVEKCYRSCSEFERSTSSGKIVVVRRDQSGESLRRFVEDPDAFMERGKLLKDGASSTVVRVRGDDHDWVIKRYNIKGFRHRLSHCLRNTRAWISWGNAHRLKISGIATPKAIALVEKRFGPLRSTGYYVSEFIDGPRADAFFSDDLIPVDQRQRAARAFVELFALLRKLGIYHGDCKASNFLVRELAPWVLDLDAMREFSSVGRCKKFSRIDRERFLRNWQAQPDLQQWFDEHLQE